MKDNAVQKEVVSTVTGCGLDDQRIVVWFQERARDFFLFQIVPRDPGAHPSAYSIDTGALRQECNSQDTNLTAHFHLVLKLHMHRAIPPLPNTPSWCGDPLSTGVTFIVCCLVSVSVYDTVLVTEVIQWCPFSEWAWPMLCPFTR